MKVYLTVCYDNDQQQTFWDYVPATSKADAGNVIGEIRGEYADIVDVLTCDVVQRIAATFRTITPQEATRDMDDLKLSHPSDEEETDAQTG